MAARKKPKTEGKKYKVFGKFDFDVEILDPGLKEYINLDSRIHLSTLGRHAKKPFGKSQVHIVERMINSLMIGGTGKKIGGRVIRDRGGCGKKAKMYKITEAAFDLINEKTGKNPVELLIRAVENAAPIEETTKVQYGGVIYHVAVDVSPMRRIDFALRNIGRAVAIKSFDTKKSMVEALADEIILASKNDASSHAISRRIEIERIARSSR